ncbi:MAG TPA: ABC transporter substrate-binding protein [Dehalococcoidales bacterium]|nr:ABC transporter substrate-binding protein [Dehalococcoidales bacterium]
MRRPIITLAVLLLITLVLTGCGGNPPANTTTVTPPVNTPSATGPATSSSPVSTAPSPTTTAPPTSTKTPKSGGTLVMLITMDPSTFFPQVMTGQTDGHTSSVSLETLFRFDKDLNLIPLLATGYQTDVAAKTVTITLRKGVKFHDGSDFNAEVCKWNLDQFRAGNRPELKKVTSIDVVDSFTVRLNLSSFDNTIVANLGNISDAGRMISKQSFEANGGKDWAAKNPVGTGPFQFVSMTKDVGVKWKRFDGYWDGKPYLDGIDMRRIADSTVALMEFRSGNLHILGSTASRDAKALEQEKNKYKIVIPPQGQVPALAGFAIDPNSPFAKIEVRRAIAHAIDVKTFTDSFGMGYWRLQNQWAVPGTWGYNPDVKGYPYNPDKARELLAAAGHTGLKAVLNFNNTGQSIVDENTALQSYLNAAGFDITLNPLQRPAFADMASNGKGWSGIVRQQGFSSPDPLIKYAGVISGQEFAGTFVPQEMVDVFNQGISAPDFATKQQLTHKLMALAVDKYCIAAYLCVQSSPISKLVVLQDDEYGEAPFGYLSPKAWLDK